MSALTLNPSAAAEVESLLRVLLSICDDRLTLADSLLRDGNRAAAVPVIRMTAPLRARTVLALTLFPGAGSVH